jgi:hypothetical protein
MNPKKVVAWLPVIREVVGLVQTIVDNVRERRAKRRARR